MIQRIHIILLRCIAIRFEDFVRLFDWLDKRRARLWTQTVIPECRSGGRLNDDDDD